VLIVEGTKRGRFGGWKNGSLSEYLRFLNIALAAIGELASGVQAFRAARQIADVVADISLIGGGWYSGWYSPQPTSRAAARTEHVTPVSGNSVHRSLHRLPSLCFARIERPL
jgi:hypothetical protein